MRENNDVAEGKDGQKASHGEVYGRTPPPAQQRQEHSVDPARSRSTDERKEAMMAENRQKLSTGPNEEPINETIAGTGPGIPDEALGPGEELIEAPNDEEVERIAEEVGASAAERDTLPLEGE